MLRSKSFLCAILVSTTCNLKLIVLIIHSEVRCYGNLSKEYIARFPLQYIKTIDPNLFYPICIAELRCIKFFSGNGRLFRFLLERFPYSFSIPLFIGPIKRRHSNATYAWVSGLLWGFQGREKFLDLTVCCATYNT